MAAGGGAVMPSRAHVWRVFDYVQHRVARSLQTPRDTQRCGGVHPAGGPEGGGTCSVTAPTPGGSVAPGSACVHSGGGEGVMGLYSLYKQPPDW